MREFYGDRLKSRAGGAPTAAGAIGIPVVHVGALYVVYTLAQH